MHPLPVGFIGAGGFVSWQHLPNALRSAEMEVRAIADLNPATLEKHRRHQSIRCFTTDYRDLLRDPEIRLLVIGTRQDLHASMIIESLEAGKWVLCEKPMASTPEESAAVLEVERRAAGRLAIGFNRRFAPAYRKLRTLFRTVPAPWFVNYRIVNQSSHRFDRFYEHEPRILYEGCHILDFACYLFDAEPEKVYMTGDRLHNNCCILSFPGGSQFQLLCASVGAVAAGKENIEIFGGDKTVMVNDFTDMRIRGFEGEHDLLFPPHRGEHAAEVMKYGFDFYELWTTTRGGEYIPPEYRIDWSALGVATPPPVRPYALPFDLADYAVEDRELRQFAADKGWIASLEHFARCCRTGEAPENADGRSGARATALALALLESLERGRPVEFSRTNWEIAGKKCRTA